METINNVVQSASKAIWGEQQATGNETLGNEPVSGVQGKGNIDEPYDQGNATNPLSTATHPSTNTISPSNNDNKNTLPDRTMNSNTGNAFSSHAHGSDPAGPHDSHLTNKADPRIDSDHVGSTGNTTGGLSNPLSSNTPGSTGNTTGGLSNPLSSNTPGSTGNTTGGLSNPLSSNTPGSTGNTTGNLSNPLSNTPGSTGNLSNPLSSNTPGSTGNTTSGSSNPLSSNTPSSIPTNPHNVAAGGDIRPHQETDKTGVIGGHGDPFKTTHDNPTERSSNPGVVGSSSDAGLTKQEGAANPTENPSFHEKSAVKETKDDTEDFLKTKDPSDHSGEPMHMHTGSGDGIVPSTQAERRESKVGNPGGQEHGKETAAGTGEQWVKTSGMAADGGDFDATKPGAGREADRLMEQKGIHKTAPGKPTEPLGEKSTHDSHDDHTHGEKEKVPIGQKIKEKLHIGHKDK
ncbi:hypothetical protein K504DRAFT_405216 [Pleomassaria siparia CBS 279.74]|uniref:Uncharacterized protein n=1 Tax=Pleomassaria siparia CBS 279.74 TaxID=1314801 RepID=A0A6G1KCQ8_9PLEO|nr:hypothetical protein K504DRAFT_405216 [Pleomassaria siparia CBS 279.74]